MQNPGSVSGPTSSGSFVLTLIRGSLQRAIHGPVQLARRPASHPPDQRQDSAVTYVAIGVVSATVIEKHIKSVLVAIDYRADAPRRHAFRDAPRHTAVLRYQGYLYTARGTFLPLGVLPLPPGSASGLSRHLRRNLSRQCYRG
ncbi:hypothetical protein SAMN05444064_13626 [Pseudomonas syringae]|nr:hypothetical protein SAMN05444514_1374 [Pseudomonas syringae]SFM81093.1 hypothetical protein SAMN05444064_13626 [Pseudomonas syringae]